MMTRLLFSSIFCLLFSFSVKGQTIAVPDANFVTFLQQNYPSCMTGNLLDTTCAAVTSATIVDVANKNIADLEGIQYFDNLLLLFAGSNQLTSLPPLPSGLVNLTVYGNQLTTLPALPNTLQILDCHVNQIAALPATLPPGLTRLSIGANPLTSLPPLPNTLLDLDVQQSFSPSYPPLPNPLPPNLELLFCGGGPAFATIPPLPSSLKSLAITNAPITTLPALPNGLISLLLNQCQIPVIPSLPPNLEQFHYNFGPATTVPVLPNSIETLIISNAPVTSMANIPNSVGYLGIDNTNLTTLPPLPASLYYMDVPDNNLVGLPPLPNNLLVLICENNQITCFPTFPNSINGWDLSGNPFNCLPNYVSSMPSTVTSYPLCLPNNSNGCANADGVAGQVFDDLNSNCGLDTGDALLRNVPVNIYDSGNNLLGTTTSAFGVYHFMPGNGTFRVELDTANKPYSFSCPNPGLDTTVTLSGTVPLITDVNFEVECGPGFDLAARSVVPSGFVFPGQDHSLRIRAGDASNFYNLHCATGVAGTVTVTVNGPVTYQSPMTGALTPSVNGNIFTYTITDFGTVNSGSDFGLVFNTDTTAQAGDSICVTVDVSPTAGDVDPSNNSYHFCYDVVNSYDPNKKEVYPASVLPGYDGWLNYTIYFQNTGNAPAFNIRLVDTLDTRLDLSTFEVMDYSHAYELGLHFNQMTIRFNNIMLPDSLSDPEGSQGYFSFRIKPLVGLQEGESLPNRAAIFFDFNDPIITNTAETIFHTPTGIGSTLLTDLGMQVYPNPSQGMVHLKLMNQRNNDLVLIRVFDVTGRVVLEKEAKGEKQFELNLGHEPAGIYQLEVVNGRNRALRKIIKL